MSNTFPPTGPEESLIQTIRAMVQNGIARPEIVRQLNEADPELHLTYNQVYHCTRDLGGLTEKPCLTCGKVKDVSLFPRKKQATDGLDYHCKACGNEKRNQRRNPTGRLTRAAQYRLNQRGLDTSVEKRCCRCLEVKTLDHFYNDARWIPDGHASACIECITINGMARQEAKARARLGEKKCSRCRTWKNLDEFDDNSRGWGIGGKIGQCRPCRREAQRENRAKLPPRPSDPHRDRVNHLRRTYGLSEADYNSMLLRQNGVCALCYKPETRTRNGVVEPLAVDHDHKTGRVRRLLCHWCNTRLGALEDSEWHQAAHAYLHEHDLAAA